MKWTTERPTEPGECVHAKRAKWRPITEVHEEFGPVVVIDANDPGGVTVQWPGEIALDDDGTRWTHFAELPLLTNEMGAAMMESLYERPARTIPMVR